MNNINISFFKKKILIPFIILTTFIIYIYISYFHYYEGRNNKQNETARRLYDIVATTLYETPQIKNNFIISSDKNISDASPEKIIIYNKINKLSSHYNIDLKNSVYYIEIRNKKVYTIIYSNWEYSGYTGSYPDYNLTCNSYHTIVRNAYSDFKSYTNDFYKKYQ